MRADAVIAALPVRGSGLVTVHARGEPALFVNPGRAVPRGAGFASVKLADGGQDPCLRPPTDGAVRAELRPAAARMPGAFRPAAAPRQRPRDRGGRDFRALDLLTPHPVHGCTGWVAVLNPPAQPSSRPCRCWTGASPRSAHSSRAAAPRPAGRPK
ncbi:MAG: DUF6194 family protein [Gemmobacter sp.]